jgi:hypothetical protein
MFSGFTFDSEVVLGSIAAFYGFQIPKPRMKLLSPISSAPACRGNLDWATTSASQTKGSSFKGWMASGSRRSDSTSSL